MSRGISYQTRIKDLIPSNLYDNFMDLSLTTQELLFVGYICTEGFHRPGEAYERSHKKEVSIQNLTAAQTRSRGLHLMGKENVRTAIKMFIDNALEPFREQFQLQQIQFWQTRATWNPLDIFSANGDVKPLDRIPKNAILAIDGVKKDFRGKEADKEVIFYELASRAEAMKQLQSIMKTGTPVEVPKEDLDTKSRVRKLLDAGRQAVEAAESGTDENKKRKKVTVKRTIEEVTLGGEEEEETIRDVTDD